MKRTIAFFMLAACAWGLLLSCEQPAGSDSASDKPTTIAPTTNTPNATTDPTTSGTPAGVNDSITGTWAQTRSKKDWDNGGNTFTKTTEQRFVLAVDGSFYETEKGTTDYDDVKITDTVEYAYNKGTWTYSSDRLTKKYTGYYESSSSIGDPSSFTKWNPEDMTIYVNAVVKDNCLYHQVFKRSGTGAGIDGTWSCELYNSEDMPNPYSMMKYSVSSGKVTAELYYSDSSTFGTKPDTSTGTVSYDASTGKGTIKLTAKEYQFVVFGNYLSYTDRVYTRE